MPDDSASILRIAFLPALRFLLHRTNEQKAQNFFSFEVFKVKGRILKHEDSDCFMDFALFT